MLLHNLWNLSCDVVNAQPGMVASRLAVVVLSPYAALLGWLYFVRCGLAEAKLSCVAWRIVGGLWVAADCRHCNSHHWICYASRLRKQSQPCALQLFQGPAYR